MRSATRWTAAGAVREVHFVSSILLALVLTYFAVTGFMAQHREWFHPRIDREDWADAEPLGEPCGVEALAVAAGVGPDRVEERGAHLLVDAADGRRLACQRGQGGVFAGEVVPWPTEVAPDSASIRAWLEGRDGRRFEEVDAAPGGVARLRASTVWAETTIEVDAARVRFVTWTRHHPLAYSLIELHRGRGRTDLVVDGAAILAVVVALSGVLHGLRYPGQRRRWMGALLLGSVLLVGALLAG